MSDKREESPPRRGRPKKARTFGTALSLRLDDDHAIVLAAIVERMPEGYRTASATIRAMIRDAAASIPDLGEFIDEA